MASMHSATTIPSPNVRGPPDEVAMRNRVLTHMNADHQLSLRLYLQHYSHVPSSGTTSAQLIDLTTEHMIISSSYGRHVIPFDPPLKSFSGTRERVVEMHNTCLHELDLSDVVVKTYILPNRAWQWMLSGLCILIYSTFPFRESLRPESGTVISKIWSLGGLAPWLARLSYTLAPLTLGFIAVAHAAETVWFINGRLRRHWVETSSVTWWCWVLDCLMAGGGALARFDELVKKAETEKRGGGSH